MSTVSFEKEIAGIEKQLETERQELQRLEKDWKSFDLEFSELRDALENLKAAAEGRTVRGAKTAQRVDVNPDTGRPSRGARRDQLIQICRRLGRGQKTFRTIDVLDRVREVEGGVSAGIRSYTYSIMKTFEEEGLLEKVDRGTWKLK